MRLKNSVMAAVLTSSTLLLSSVALWQNMPSANAADAGAALSTLGPNTIADIAQAAAPAVVNLEVVASKPGVDLSGAFPGLPNGMQFFFNGQPFEGGGPHHGNAPRFEQRDTGSGFIVRPNGYILTNRHVIRDAEKIKVTLNDKRVFDGKVVGVDPFSDLAVVKIEADNLPTLKMGSSTGLRPGEFAIAIGSPMELDHTVTFGIISAVGRSVTDINGNINFIQTDAAINPGNSGGPLLNLNGEVIGVNTAIDRRAQNVGFSIPIDVAKQVSESLIASGKILRPWLGIQMHELDEAMIKGFGVPANTKGVVIAGFVENSPAKASGLEPGDIIQKIDGKDMLSPKDVKEYVQTKKVSDTLHFVVMRGNHTATARGGRDPEVVTGNDGFSVKPVAIHVGDYATVMEHPREALAPGEQQHE